jgi:phage terminase Nu1 subunit (DNA packaging protein)
VRLPWQRRADAEIEKRKHAEKRLESAQADWSQVRQEVHKQEVVDVDIWTERILSVFGTPIHHKEGRTRG